MKKSYSELQQNYSSIYTFPKSLYSRYFSKSQLAILSQQQNDTIQDLLTFNNTLQQSYISSQRSGFKLFDKQRIHSSDNMKAILVDNESIKKKL